MKYNFNAELSAYIEVTDEQFSHIWECMEHHYDFTINDAVRQGGFMWGLRNMRTPYPGQSEEDINRFMQMTIRQMGLVLKSLENMHCMPKYDCEITKKFSAVLKIMAIKTGELNEGLNIDTEI